MANLTQDAFIRALIDKFEPTELIELLGVDARGVVVAFYDDILAQQSSLEEELKYGH